MMPLCYGDESRESPECHSPVQHTVMASVIGCPFNNFVGISFSVTSTIAGDHYASGDDGRI